MKAVFDDWAGELSHDECKDLVSKLKERKFSYLVFSSRHPLGIKLFEPKKMKAFYITWMRKISR